MLANTKSLVAEINRLQAYVTAALAQGVMGGDFRLVLLGVAQGRGNVETLARLGPLANMEQRLAALEEGRANPNDDGA